MDFEIWTLKWRIKKRDTKQTPAKLGLSFVFVFFGGGGWGVGKWSTVW